MEPRPRGNMHIIAGPPGAGKTTFVKWIIQSYFQENYVTAHYRNRDQVRAEMSGITGDGQFTWDTMMQKLRAADVYWFDDLRQALALNPSGISIPTNQTVLVEWPLHRHDEMTGMIELARSARFNPIVSILYDSNPVELLQRDIARRFKSRQYAQDTIDMVTQPRL